MKNLKYSHFFAIIAAVGLAYLFLRRKTDVVSTQPNPAGAGVNPNTPQAQEYNVNPPVLQPNPGMIFLPDNQTTPEAPQYLTYNFKPTYDTAFINAPNSTAATGGLTPIAKDSSTSCGCGGTCQDCVTDCQTLKSRYPDGRGGCMAVNRNKQIAQLAATQPDLFDDYADNLASAQGTDLFTLFRWSSADSQLKRGAIDPSAPGDSVPAGFYIN